jgi:hypothetical protein
VRVAVVKQESLYSLVGGCSQQKNENDESITNLFNQHWRAVCKASSVEIKCEVANGDFLGFDLKPVCFQ